jgi:hypothetical protein
VPYEQALALKELGFDESCFGYYLNREFNFFYNTIISKRINSKTKNIFNSDVIVAPTYQQAFRWFREKHNLISVVGYHNLWKYSFLIETIEEHKTIIVVDKINTYEEAELECLKKLIEIVKQNNNE